MTKTVKCTLEVKHNGGSKPAPPGSRTSYTDIPRKTRSEKNWSLRKVLTNGGIFTVVEVRHPGMPLYKWGIRQSWMLSLLGPPSYLTSLPGRTQGDMSTRRARRGTPTTHRTSYVIQYPGIMGSAVIDVERVFCDTQCL